jgi:hypothetical protein
MMDKRRKDKNVIIPNSPLPGFVHKALPNGLVISTCLRCKKSIGSPTPASLRMAEENHLCVLLAQKSR